MSEHVYEMANAEAAPYRVLVVDDDPKFRKFVAEGLREYGTPCETAADAVEALEQLRRFGPNAFELVLLDVMMPGPSGWDLITDMRARGWGAPVIFVTAHGEVADRIQGLRLGGDDYIVKPFAFAELRARMDAVVRRHRATREVALGDIRLDLQHRSAWCRGQRLELSPREFALLQRLIESAGRAVSRADLLQDVWHVGRDPETNVIEVHVGRLRRRLAVSRSVSIRTFRGEGYGVVIKGDRRG